MRKTARGKEPNQFYFMLHTQNMPALMKHLKYRLLIHILQVLKPLRRERAFKARVALIDTLLVDSVASSPEKAFFPA